MVCSNQYSCKFLYLLPVIRARPDGASLQGWPCSAGSARCDWGKRMNRIFDMACRRTLLTCAALSLSFGVAQPGWAGGRGGYGATSATGGHRGAGSDGTATNMPGARGGMHGAVSGINATGIGAGGTGQRHEFVPQMYVAEGGG